MTDPKLKPCPFCGDPGYMHTLTGNLDGPWAYHCSRCRSYGPEGKTDDEAARLWNSRPTTQTEQPSEQARKMELGMARNATREATQHAIADWLELDAVECPACSYHVSLRKLSNAIRSGRWREDEP